MFHQSVKTLAKCVFVGFLLSCDLAPSSGDVLSFQSLLANYTMQKHLATSPNLTSDGQHHAATRPSNSESRLSLTVNFTRFLGIEPRNMPEYYFTCIGVNWLFLYLTNNIFYILNLCISLQAILGHSERGLFEHLLWNHYWTIALHCNF